MFLGLNESIPFFILMFSPSVSTWKSFQHSDRPAVHGWDQNAQTAAQHLKREEMRQLAS